MGRLAFGFVGGGDVMWVNLKLKWISKKLAERRAVAICLIEESRSASEPSAKPKASRIGCPLLPRRVGAHENGSGK